MGEVLYASQSGWFPFCLRNQNTGAAIPPDPRWFPSPIRLEDAMRWYWRVRKWKIQVSKDNGEFGIFTDTKFVEHPNIGVSFLSQAAPIEREEDYVCKPISYLGLLAYNPDFDPGSGENDFGCRIYFATDPDNVFNDWGIYRKPAPEEQIDSKDYDFYYALNFVYGEIGGVDLSAGTHTTSINYPDGPDEIKMEFSEVNFIKIYPERYWSYGGFYNEATGEPIGSQD